MNETTLNFAVDGIRCAAEQLADLCERKCHDTEVIAVSNAFQFLSDVLKQLEPADYKDDPYELGVFLTEQALNDFSDLEDKLITK